MRLDGEALAKVDAEQRRLAKEAPHFAPNRSDAVRSLIARAPVVEAMPRRARAPRVVVVASGGEGSIEVGTGGPVAVKGEC